MRQDAPARLALDRSSVYSVLVSGSLASPKEGRKVASQPLVRGEEGGTEVHLSLRSTPPYPHQKGRPHKHPISPCRHQSSLVQNKLWINTELRVNVRLAGRGGEGGRRRGSYSDRSQSPGAAGRPRGRLAGHLRGVGPGAAPGAARVGDDVQPRALAGVRAAVSALAGVRAAASALAGMRAAAGTLQGRDAGA